MKHRMKKAPMGWNSYDYYDTTVTEEQVKSNADYMAVHMKDSGWEYIVVDIEWYAKDAGTLRDKYQYIPFGDEEIDEFGRLFPAVNRFPSAAGGKGFGPLAEYVHNLGLKFGIHIMRGIPRKAAHEHMPVFGTNVTANEIADPSSICRWNPDMYGVRKDAEGAQEYYDSIINLYAQWGVDFIKCDDICNTNTYPHDPYSAAHEVEMLQRAIQKSGRNIVLSLSPGPALIEKSWHYEKYANMWRITDDFWDQWDLLRNMFDRCELWQNHVAEGSYPDCDMLPLGKLGKGFGKAEWDTNFTKDEQITMMTLWCIFGSPLMIGAELTKLDAWTLDLLTRKDILKLVSNDYVGKQFEKKDDHAIWSCLNKVTGEKYLAFFNFKETAQEIKCSVREVEQFADIEVTADYAKELWSQKEIALHGNILIDTVPSHGARLFQLR
ncbi:MAG: glycoside hydrolase family 27 protein [Lachnospiraceae bacterium]|nr:glycoside hydrolase family 27 protein [Lachnospiraceae bacterium]MDE7203339.1 glycoside hydrolase family 27 protein [Lachnospiraceae bacterium]